MTVLRIGTMLFFLSGAIIAFRGVLLGFRFARYLEDQHPTKYQSLVAGDPLRSMLWLYYREQSLPGFMWYSSETLGDSAIGAFRSQLRSSLYTFFANGIAALIYFAAVALWLEQA